MNHESRTTNHEPRITNHESRVTSHESRVTNHESRSTNHESRVTIHESRVTIHESRSMYSHQAGTATYRFPDLKTLLAKATPARTGDELAGIAAASAEERVVAQMALADVPLKTFLNESVIAYEQDDVTRLNLD